MAAISRVSVALAALLALLAVAGASTLTVFEGPGCTRNLDQYSLGCSNIRYHGGYSFTYTGAIAIFFNNAGCIGSSAEVISGDGWNCTRFTYKSVRIIFPRSDGPWDITAKN